MRRFASYLVLALLLPTKLWAATICVSPATGCGSSQATVQAAVNAAAAGDTVILGANTTYTETVTLPNKGVLGSFITITSNASALNLPAAGYRTGPANAVYMPKIVSPLQNQQTILTAAGANHYKFQHIEFPPAPNGAGALAIIQLGANDSTQAFASQEPSDIIIDQCYLHGDPVYGTHRGVESHAVRVTISNSYMTNMVAVGQDSQCIEGINGHGPMTVTNNFLQCGTENLIFGGGDPAMRTYMRATGTPTTTGASVSTYEASHTLAELAVGQVITAKTTGGTKVESSVITSITGSGATGSLTWSPAMSAAPDVPGDMRAGVIFSGLTFRFNDVSRDPAWTNGVLAQVTTTAATGGGAGTLGTGSHCYVVQAHAVGYLSTDVHGKGGTERCATLASAGTVTNTWAAVTGAATYRVFRGTTAGTESEYFDTASLTLVDDGSLTWTAGTPPALPTFWQMKTLFEIKCGQNIQVDSNIFHEHHKDSDIGSSMWLKSVNQDGEDWWCESKNITVEKNIFHDIYGWVLIHGAEFGSAAPLPLVMHDVTLRNNLVYNSTSAFGNDISGQVTGNVWGFQMSARAGNNITLDHNTVIHTTDGTGGGVMDVEQNGSPTESGLVITNNMLRAETYGIHHDTVAEGSAALNAAAPGYSFLNNGLANNNQNTNVSTTNYPASNLYDTLPNWQAAFTAYSTTGAGADYHITTGAAGNSYRNAGTDGKDIGADITAVLAATSTVVSGVPANTITRYWIH